MTPDIGTLISFLTDTTCGEACWSARDDTCRCSCGGKNHGVLRTVDGDRPARTCRISGDIYTLRAVGREHELDAEADNLCRAVGPYRVDEVCEGLTYRYYWKATELHAPARPKPATKDQIKRWPELSAYRNLEPWEWAVLLWVKECKS
ncbi:MAG: hypothetical protein IPO08_22725 [Xanthomonadales bacterium]|nr:hypothetical protein [Xanthomonadales bacterium]